MDSLDSVSVTVEINSAFSVSFGAQVDDTAELLFAKDSNVPFTNNRVERDLRIAKVKQKTSGCFRKEIYAQAFSRISSYLQAMSNQDISLLVATQMALVGLIHDLKTSMGE